MRIISAFFLSFFTLTAAAADLCDGRDLKPMITTVYYSPTMTTETVNCPARKGCRRWVGKKRKRTCAKWSSSPAQTLNAIVERDGRINRNCGSIRAALKMQGSATVFQNVNSSGRGSKALAIYKVDKKGNMAKEELERESACPAGIGRGQICLNPFKFVAAPLGFTTGDVIHVPEVATAKMRYPEYPGQPKDQWPEHDGNFIVGDSGAAIRATKKTGLGRFDFYSGLMHWRDPENPLSKMGFGSSKNKKYCRLDGNVAQKIKESQDYPRFPDRLKTAWLEGVGENISVAALVEPETPADKAPAPVPRVQRVRLSSSWTNTGSTGFFGMR